MSAPLTGTAHESSQRKNLRLDRFVLGVGNQLGLEHLLGLLQAANGLRLPTRTCGRRHAAHGSGADLDASGARAQLLQLANTPLFAPGLILRLTDAIHGLGLRLAKALEIQAPRGGRAL